MQINRFIKNHKQDIAIIALICLVLAIATSLVFWAFKISSIDDKILLQLNTRCDIIELQNEQLINKLDEMQMEHYNVLSKLNYIDVKLNKLAMLDHIKLSVETQESLYNTIDELLEVISK